MKSSCWSDLPVASGQGQALPLQFCCSRCEPMNGTPTKSSADSRHRGALIIWGAQVMALVMLFALTRIVGRGADAGGGDRVLLLVLAAAALMAFALSFVLKAKLISQA